MAGSDKRVQLVGVPATEDPQSEQVVKHLKDARSGKRIGSNLPHELDADAPENLYLKYIKPSKTPEPNADGAAAGTPTSPTLSHKGSAGDAAAQRSPPVAADAKSGAQGDAAGTATADLRKELEQKTKQVTELRDRLKEFQEIANTYGNFKDLALQLSSILKASMVAQETIAALNTQQRALSESVAAFQKLFLESTKSPLPRPVVINEAREPEVREVIKEVIKEVRVEVPVEIIKEVIKEVRVEVPVAVPAAAAAAAAAEAEVPAARAAAAEPAAAESTPKLEHHESTRKRPVRGASSDKVNKEERKAEEAAAAAAAVAEEKKEEKEEKKLEDKDDKKEDKDEEKKAEREEKKEKKEHKEHKEEEPSSPPASREGSRIESVASPEAGAAKSEHKEKEDEERKARHRRESLKELVETERGYVRDLTVLFKIYLQPIQKAQLLTKQDVDAIFPTEDTLMLHTAILAELETALAKPAEQQNVGEVFIKKVDYLKLYTHYCSIQENGTAVLKKLMHENKKLARALEDARHKPECNKLDLPSYLIKPVQRICKYPLLLREILKNLPADHKDVKSLQAALAKVSEIVSLINERSRKTAQASTGTLTNNKMGEILGQISFGATTTFQHREGRKFVAEARVKMFTPKDGKLWGRQLFVFNDIVVLCRLSTAPGAGKRYKYEETLPFESTLLYDEADRDWEKASGIKNLIHLIRVLDTAHFYFMVKTSDDKKKLIGTLRENMKGPIHEEKIQRMLPEDAILKAKRLLEGGGSRISRAYMNSPVVERSDRSEKEKEKEKEKGDRSPRQRDKRKSVA